MEGVPSGGANDVPPLRFGKASPLGYYVAASIPWECGIQHMDSMLLELYEMLRICQNVVDALVLRLLQQHLSSRASIPHPLASLSSLSAKSKATHRISIDIPCQLGSSSLHFKFSSLSNSQPLPRRCICITDHFGCARGIPAIIGYGLVPKTCPSRAEDHKYTHLVRLRSRKG